MKIQKSKLALYLLNTAALAAFVCLLVYSLSSKEVMVWLFSNVSYYLISLIFILWAVQTALLLKTINFSLKEFLKKYWPGILTAFILTCLVFVSVEVKFKTLSDEAHLLSTSRCMADDKTAVDCTMAIYCFGNLNSIENIVPKRPLVFPYMVHLLHVLTGFRYQNAFILNFLVLFLMLSGVYVSTRHFTDAPSSAAAMIFILSYPVITIFSTSAGFDLLNSAFFVLIIAAVYYFIKTPSSAGFSFIFASLIMFSNIRYESALFLFVLPLLLFKKIKWSHLKESSYLIFITPLVSLPYIWQRLLQQGSYENPEGSAVFSISSLAANLTTFFNSLIDFEYYLPYAGLLSVLSILIFLYLAIKILSKKVELTNYGRYFLFVLTASVSISTIVYFAHFFGDYSHPFSARFFITLSIVFALGPVALKILKPDLLSGKTVLLLSAVCFLFYHPIAVEGRFMNKLGHKTNEHCRDFISRFDDKNILILSGRPVEFTALGYGSVDFDYANSHKDNILKQARKRLFSRIIVCQEIKYESKQPTERTFLRPDYVLKTLYEIQTSETELLRISEVKLPEVSY